MQPHWRDPIRLEAQDLATCASLLRGGSRSFHVASLLLPQKIRGPAAALYAFCRLADDAIDVDRGQVDALRVRLGMAYDGRPLPIAADRALAAVVARYAIPQSLPEALLEGFAWDAEGRRYEDLAALQAYAARVAGSVGAMMAVLMGARATDVVARACDLGIAMQLTNIARDVGEDAHAGRLYLPLQWLREAGIDPNAWLARPVFTKALGGVIARLLHEADEIYARADAGIACLPALCRPGIHAARWLYAGIGREVARRGFDSVTQRAAVPPVRKAALLVHAAAAAAGRSAGGPAPSPMPAARFLIEAVAAAPQPPQAPCARGRRSLDERIAWLVELFLSLDERRHAEP